MEEIILHFQSVSVNNVLDELYIKSLTNVCVINSVKTPFCFSGFHSVRQQQIADKSSASFAASRLKVQNQSEWGNRKYENMYRAL